jgi:hypothetical protein
MGRCAAISILSITPAHLECSSVLAGNTRYYPSATRVTTEIHLSIQVFPRASTLAHPQHHQLAFSQGGLMPPVDNIQYFAYSIVKGATVPSRPKMTEIGS